jgi:hypothetical protein
VGPDDDLTITPLDDPDAVAGLAADAAADGRGMVERLVEEWRDGRNRFDRPGERAYVARLGGRASGRTSRGSAAGRAACAG